MSDIATHDGTVKRVEFKMAADYVLIDHGAVVPVLRPSIAPTD